MDGLGRELEDEAVLVRLNALSADGRSAAREYGVRAVPTLLVFDACGTMIDAQIGLMNAPRAAAAVREAGGCVP